MKALVAHIVFGASRNREELNIYRPSMVKIQKSWKLLTDTALITLPRNVADFDKERVKDVFKAGDPVTIQLGYDGEYYTEFVGFISRVSADIPIQLHCEDAMWKLKQIPAHISRPAGTLRELIESIVSDYEIDAAEFDIGPCRYPNYTVAKVLDDLKSKYGFYSYMRGETLVCGKIYADDTDIASINLNMEQTVQQNNLEYRHSDDIIIKIIAVSTLCNGKKLRVEVGEEGGEVKQLPYYGIPTEAALQQIAEEDLKKYKVDGFRGTISTFGIPPIEHGNKVNLSSELYPDREGLYYVESVNVDFGEGFRYKRTVTLGDRAI